MSRLSGRRPAPPEVEPSLPGPDTTRQDTSELIHSDS
jgi:hypothetical protein